MHSLQNKLFNLLRLLERFLKIDMVYATKNSFWNTFSFTMGVVGSLATMVAFGNLLPRETYGVYTYLISLGSSLTFLTLSGTGPAVMRAIARGIDNLVPEALRIQLRYNLLAIAVILGVAAYYFYKGNEIFGASLLLLSIAYPVGEAFHIYAQVLIGKKRFDLLAKATSIISLLGALATVITLVLTQNILAIISVFAVMNTVPKILMYRWTVRGLPKSPPAQEDISEMRRTAFHITGAGLIGTIAAYVDKVILFQAAGPAALAVYGFALAGPDRLKSLLKGWLTIAFPRLAENSLKDIRGVFYKRIALSIVVGFVLAGLYITLSPFLFKILLPKYLDSIIYSQVLALSLLAAPVSVYIGGIFAGQNMLKAIYLQNIGSHIARIALFVSFTLMWKTWGLVIASIASQFVSSIYSVVIWEIESRRLIKKNG